MTNPTVVVIVEGGIVTETLSDLPVDVIVCDYDVDGNEGNSRIHHDNGTSDPCNISSNNIVVPKLIPKFKKARESSQMLEMPALTKRQFNAVLAGLRLLQSSSVGRKSHIHQILTDGNVDELSDDEIDALCGQIN